VHYIGANGLSSIYPGDPKWLPRRCNACGLPLVHLRGLSGHWMHAGTSMAECCALSAAAFAAATYKPSIELVRLLCQHFAHELRLQSSSLDRKLTCSFLENVALLYLRLGPHAHRQALTARALRTAANPESSTAVKEAIAVVLVEAQGPFKYYLRNPEFRNSQVRLSRILFSSKALHLPMPCNLCTCSPLGMVIPYSRSSLKRCTSCCVRVRIDVCAARGVNGSTGNPVGVLAI
jgi:hypothetical protein